MKILRDLWKYAFNFRGYAGRKEFFSSLLVTYIAMIVCFPAAALLYILSVKLAQILGADSDQALLVGTLVAVVYIVTLVRPLPALTVRRMRDSGLPMWYLVLFILGIPVLGFLMIGLAKADPGATKRCFLTRLARVILLTALGGYLWCVPLYVFSVEEWSLIAMGALGAGTVGIVLGGIGGIMDRIRLQKAAAEKGAENTP